ncbi:AsnC family protein [Paracoccus sediminis]|uniref:AsnC family protein n=2 Tax=Paracoccus sediminis TaxID=1214787 RepID=A0ABY1YLU4_9RHOB|nr:AsnC family protein [Paracoccus sediminis]
MKPGREHGFGRCDKTAARPDLIDRKIAAAVMKDASRPIAQTADRAGLSQTPCWKRIPSSWAS